MARWNPRKWLRGSSGPDWAAEADRLFREGDYARAHAAYAAAVEAFQREIEARPGDLRLNAEIAVMTDNLGRCLGTMGRHDEAVLAHDGAIAVLDALTRAAPPESRPRFADLLAGALVSKAFSLVKADRLAPALESSRRAVELCRSLSSTGESLGGALLMFVHVRAQTGVELDDAHRAYDEAMAVYMNLLGADPRPAYVEQMYALESELARVFQAQGRREDARRLTRLVQTRHLDGLVPMLLAQRDAPRG